MNELGIKLEDVPSHPRQMALRHTWNGLERACPKCGKVFISQHDRGACTNCRFVFEAFDVYGLPEGAEVDWDEFLQEKVEISDESSQRIMTTLTGRADSLPERPTLYDKDDPEIKFHAEQWDFEALCFHRALELGAELWNWDTGCSAGLAAIKEGRVLAVGFCILYH